MTDQEVQLSEIQTADEADQLKNTPAAPDEKASPKKGCSPAVIGGVVGGVVVLAVVIGAVAFFALRGTSSDSKDGTTTATTYTATGWNNPCVDETKYNMTADMGGGACEGDSMVDEATCLSVGCTYQPDGPDRMECHCPDVATCVCDTCYWQDRTCSTPFDVPWTWMLGHSSCDESTDMMGNVAGIFAWWGQMCCSGSAIKCQS